MNNFTSDPQPSDVTIEISEASDPVGGESMGYKEAWIASAFSNYEHHLSNYPGKWDVAFVEPNNGDSMSTEDARAYLAECTRIVVAAEQLNATDMGAASRAVETSAELTREFHFLVQDSFDNGIVEASIGRGDADGDIEADILFEGSGIMTADEYREAADKYEAFPAWLREFADRLDAVKAASA